MLRYSEAEKIIREYMEARIEQPRPSNSHLIAENCPVGALAVHEGWSFIDRSVNDKLADPYTLAAKALGMMAYSPFPSEKGTPISAVYWNYDQEGLDAALAAIRQHYERFYPDML